MSIRKMLRSIVEWATLLLVALGATLLLTSAAAYAECAWVLWRESSSGSSSGVEWYPDGYPTSKECYDELNRREKALSDGGWHLTAGGPNIWAHAGVPNVYRFRCLPDTVDPRSPKAR